MRTPACRSTWSAASGGPGNFAHSSMACPTRAMSGKGERTAAEPVVGSGKQGLLRTEHRITSPPRRERKAAGGNHLQIACDGRAGGRRWVDHRQELAEVGAQDAKVSEVHFPVAGEIALAPSG